MGIIKETEDQHSPGSDRDNTAKPSLDHDYSPKSINDIQLADKTDANETSVFIRDPSSKSVKDKSVKDKSVELKPDN